MTQNNKFFNSENIGKLILEKLNEMGANKTKPATTKHRTNNVLGAVSDRIPMRIF